MRLYSRFQLLLKTLEKKPFPSSLASFTGSIRHKTNVCIVGSGPAGFYTAELLLKNADVNIDIIEKLPIPFGLIRYGVAPDHPEIKNAINKFTDIAQNERCNFYGNVNVGQDVSLKELLGAYNAVVLAYGAAEDQKLSIPGENSRNVFSAKQIVGWYNGIPANVEEAVDLDTEVAAIIGHGNVAIDVARILLRNTDELEKTDIAEHALQALKKSKIRKVVLIGRRGPLQVAFTVKELRELSKLNGCHTVIQPHDLLGVKEVLPSIQRPRYRLTELLLAIGEASQERREAATKEIEIKFFRKPKAIVYDGNNAAKKIVLTVNKVEGSLSGNKIVSTDEEETIDCGLIVRSVGYRSTVIDPLVPFNKEKSVIPNKQGRVNCEDALYCSGWLKTGPVGVIPTTMRSSYETAAKLLNDLEKGAIPTGNNGGSDEILPLLRNRGVLVTNFDHWKKMDAVEQQRGKAVGKPREKICKISEMLSISGLL